MNLFDLEEDRESINKLFKDWVLRIGSETPCNKNLINRVKFQEIAPTIPSRLRETFCVKDVSLAKLFNSIEDLPMPLELKSKFNIDEEDWSAALRFVTLIFCALTKEEKV